ncbi:hypothetical protein N7462_005624 [Penicillium macrosclerotiorum]|uniref:uncharacterized protein n=1 Tax=Penicillium macrosclerotiorum TaxID=303699 RepID=UPI0025473211|nr:uncharacterized protein N7462_005624 [Penicillium macrosclerotiorum]KAJ5682459.1 hypothetical protein N7462_005624 [Penicillium macrosclerotiorum]
MAVLDSTGPYRTTEEQSGRFRHDHRRRLWQTPSVRVQRVTKHVRTGHDRPVSSALQPVFLTAGTAVTTSDFPP